MQQAEHRGGHADAECQSAADDDRPDRYLAHHPPTQSGVVHKSADRCPTPRITALFEHLRHIAERSPRVLVGLLGRFAGLHALASLYGQMRLQLVCQVAFFLHSTTPIAKTLPHRFTPAAASLVPWSSPEAS